MPCRTEPPHWPIIVAMTGASGAVYGLRLLECLFEAGRSVQLLLSDAARQVIALEISWHLPPTAAEIAESFRARYRILPTQLRVYDRNDWSAPPASGSARAHSMVVCPCSMGTLSAIAHGSSDHLLERAADVSLKEGRMLILVVRETPFSVIHLENMLHLSRAGAVILPACPGFYHQPTSITDLVDFVVARILDRLNIPHDLSSRWE